MDTLRLFAAPTPEAMWAVPVFALGALVTALWHRRKGRDLTFYHADLAWLRGGIYFCLCWAVSMLTGVWHTLVTTPWGPGETSSPALWLASVCALVAFAYVAYWRVWASGTTALDRKRYAGSAIVFGLLWGAAEAQLFLSFWALAERSQLGVIWVGLISYLAIGAFYGPWHRFYWDFHVAPEHNIPEWNARKVIFVHTPNVLLTLTFLAYFQDPHTFVAVMAFCLVGATWTMRFPAPGDTVSCRKIVDSYKPTEAIAKP